MRCHFPIQVVPLSIMEGLWRACRSDSFDNVQETVKVSKEENVFCHVAFSDIHIPE